MALLCRNSAYRVFALPWEGDKYMIVYARLQKQGESNVLSYFHVEDNVKFLFIATFLSIYFPLDLILIQGKHVYIS